MIFKHEIPGYLSSAMIRNSVAFLARSTFASNGSVAITRSIARGLAIPTDAAKKAAAADTQIHHDM
jgi:hypothetical protein